MQQLTVFSVVIISLLFSFKAIAGKKHCQGYRAKLDNIQAQQRQANSNKRSHSLANKEAKARDKWWQCETGKLKPKSKKKTAKKSSKNKITQPSFTYAKPNGNKVLKPLKPLMPFASNNPVVVRAKYQDEKLQAWLSYYQPASMCARPKSTQQFAACVEDKRRQQIEFEQNY